MHVRIDLLGGFTVTLDGVTVPDSAWSRRHAAALVKLLALARSHRLHRDQVIESLWPRVPPEAASPRLHKAAHYARRALADHPESLVLRQDTVLLFSETPVEVDVELFVAHAEAARAADSAPLAEEALALYTGPLLPDDLYEPWSEQPRRAVEALRRDLLRLTGRWEELSRVDPLDEQAYLELARTAAARGDVRGALRQLERLDQALKHALGTMPGPEVEALRSSLLRSTARLVTPSATPGVPPGTPPKQGGTRLVGRRQVGDRLRRHLAEAEAGRGSTVLVTGPPGVGKTSVLRLAGALAEQRSWRVGRGTASAVEGAWPYACVLEALADLCRQHPRLLDGLDDNYRQELERALSARDVVWSGESAHQRLFVAAAELVRLAAAGHGLLLAVDDVHEADEASLRLVHYLARCAVTEPVVLVIGHRGTSDQAVREIDTSLVTRGIGSRVELAPLDEPATRRLLAQQFPTLDEPAVERVWTVSAGLPFTALELARAEVEGRPLRVEQRLPRPALRTIERVALLGGAFTTDELLAVAGVDDDEAYEHLDVALQSLVVEPAESGYRFRHALIRESLIASMSPHARSAARRYVAERLAGMGASPSRVAHQFIEAGAPHQAIAYVLRAVETAGALGAYRDGLDLVDAVIDHAGPEHRGHLLARRGDLLTALGSPEAVGAYLEAVPLTTGVEQRLVRARLARVAAFRADYETARAALDGLEPQGDAADGPILLARGNLSYFTGDIEAAWEATTAARRVLLTPRDPWHYVDLISLQGLIAHQRGEWFARFREELRRTAGRPDLATALFDAHLCVAEYLLYGPIPYPEVIELAEGLRRRAARFGALRGQAFASALIGESALLMGDLERAEHELGEALDLHREADAPAGEAHNLQRLAEVRIAQGDLAEARRLLQAALPLARWSVNALHLLQRIYGSMIAAAPDRWVARAVVDQADAAMGETDACPFCAVMLEVPATIACAAVGDLDAARRHMHLAEASAARWEGDAWTAAVHEARAHIAHAEGDEDGFSRLLEEAERLFTVAGHPLEAARVRSARAATTAGASVPV